MTIVVARCVYYMHASINTKIVEIRNFMGNGVDRKLLVSEKEGVRINLKRRCNHLRESTSCMGTGMKESIRLLGSVTRDVNFLQGWGIPLGFSKFGNFLSCFEFNLVQEIVFFKRMKIIIVTNFKNILMKSIFVLTSSKFYIFSFTVNTT